MKPALIAWAAVAAVFAVAPLAAPAAPAGTLASSGRNPQGGAFYDSRLGSATAAVHAGARTLRARRSLVRALGPQATLTVDPLTGTPRNLQRLSGALTGATRGDRTAIALAYARANAGAIGLTSADLDRLALAERSVSSDGVMHLRWQQAYRGIPLFDNDLRVNVDRAGRIVNVLGSPVHDPTVGSIDPLLSGLEALRRVMDGAGGRVPASVVSGPQGTRRDTRFSGGNTARLVLFTTAAGVRLAWTVVYQAGPLATLAAVVDARTGALLYRVNLTKFDVPPTAMVWENYPGAPAGGDPQTQNLDALGYLPAGSDTLDGPNARAWSDLNANGQPDPSPGPSDEEIHSHQGGNFEYVFTSYGPQPPPLTYADPPLCPLQFACAWDPDNTDSWTVNRRQEAVQAFYYANEFHNHLKAAPISFTQADGAFDSASAQPDPVQVATDVGLGLGAQSSGFLDNGSMTVNPDGTSPLMRLYMFRYGPTTPFRDIAGGDDAATVYHEYTHGLSGRLIESGGFEALNTVQAGAMSEAFSDWYAEDYLVAKGVETDVPNHPGDIDIGRYSDYGAHTTRTQAADCSVGASASVCPGGQSGQAGGYTYGDFGKIVGHPEVHADGEIFLETLWDIRAAVGSSSAEALITGAMRLVPPEPSFLDMRNAILAEDGALYSGAHTAALWSIFASRGMGFYAATTSSDDYSPVQDFRVPPSPSGAKGSVAGTVTDADTAAPLAGARVGIAGHVTPGVAAYAIGTSAAADGSYRLNGVPAGPYPELVASSASVYDPVVQPVNVIANSTAGASFKLHRDWAGMVGGGSATSQDDVLDSIGCGPEAAIDQHPSIGWSAYNPAGDIYPSGLRGGSPALTLGLQAHVDISSFAIDPAATCSDDASAATRDYRIETSSDDGRTYTCSVTTVALGGCPAPIAPFAATAAHKRNLVAPRAGATNVDFVRVTLLHPLGSATGQSGHDFIDLAEIGVYGTQADVLPSGGLVVDPNPTNIHLRTRFDASSFTDPDSAIVGYRWDYNGDGKADRATVGPRSSFTYTHQKHYIVTVTAIDARGGQGSASATVAVGNAPAPKLTVRVLSGARVRVSAKCGLPCELRATLTVSKAVARAAHISTTLGKGSRAVLHAGQATVTLRIGSHTRRKLLNAGIRKVTATVRASARDARDRVRRKTARTTLRP